VYPEVSSSRASQSSVVDVVVAVVVVVEALVIVAGVASFGAGAATAEAAVVAVDVDEEDMGDEDEVEDEVEDEDGASLLVVFEVRREESSLGTFIIGSRPPDGTRKRATTAVLPVAMRLVPGMTPF